MNAKGMASRAGRRTFLKQMAGAAGVVVAHALLSPQKVLGANNRVRLGLIGAGDRGTEIFKAALRCPNTVAVAAADVYRHRLDAIKQVAPRLKTYTDFRRLLDDKSIDAVLIATPQHQHALNFVPAIQAGKDVYQEKTMAFSPDHAKRMRRSYERSGRVVQVGVQSTSGPGCALARRLATPERIGVITLIHTHHYRNAPYGGWKRRIPADCDAQHVDWTAFQGEAKRQAFSSDRVMNWRFYWDYSGGNVFENMVHQVGFWYKVLDLRVPLQVSMTGANFLSPKMEPPDTMEVSMRLENLLFTWSSAFGNHHYGETDDVVGGTKGTLVRNQDGDVRYLSERREAKAADDQGSSAAGSGANGDAAETQAHMQNFLDCVRSRKQPNCHFELGFRSAIACQMAVASYRHGRTVRWDASREEIV
ncbi:MAG TPA: Gfo/Idh/MocA family oxidoreductase [Gemmataceae bacterium]|jgi:predicted dehydrogenase|nr:Gfo/Idh/MocA family oxidoreductase [Gemmataceae bacterium]